MKTNHMITDQNKSLIREFWNNFVSIYKIDIILAFILLIVVAATASIYPYLIQLVFDGLLDDNSNWIIFLLLLLLLQLLEVLQCFSKYVKFQNLIINFGRYPKKIN